VVVAPVHDALRLAEDAAMLDHISRGRLRLGLGLGWRPEEYRMFGVGRRNRVSCLVDTVQVLRKAFTGERFSDRRSPRPRPCSPAPPIMPMVRDESATNTSSGRAGKRTAGRAFTARIGNRQLPGSLRERGPGPRRPVMTAVTAGRFA
jgi:alkanesulfonate monooxygenase SsuD/methylene tetrahydromethanopterin reductase-like flavin-dependent oxidoreductase (luciferase family)